MKGNDMSKISAWLKAKAVNHAVGIAVALVLLFAFRMYLVEREARMKADATVKAAQSQIDSLKAQQNTVAQTAHVKTQALQKKAAAVKTPEAAVKALEADPEVQRELPTLVTLPDAPDKVEVSALDLFHGVNECEQDAVNLDACTKELSIQQQIDTQKDTQITALRARPGFWHRLGKGLKVIGCAGAGGALGSLTKTAEGAAVGAAAGAGLCQAF
jgi:hypothetical protein